MTDANLRAVVPERIKRLAGMRASQQGMRLGEYLTGLILDDANDLTELIPNGDDAA